MRDDDNDDDDDDAVDVLSLGFRSAFSPVAVLLAEEKLEDETGVRKKTNEATEASKMQKGLSASCSSSHGSHMILTLKRVRENEDPSVSNASKSSRSLLDSGSSVFVLDTGGGDDDEDDEGILRKALHNRPRINYCYPGSSLEEEERENDGEYCKDGESDSEQVSGLVLAPFLASKYFSCCMINHKHKLVSF